ncbi:MAG: PACE efflux transporter [Leucobacter sp.]
MSPHVRRIIYVVTFELVAIVIVTIALFALGHSGAGAGITAVASSTVAMIWNYIWTTIFEAWEKRQVSQHRTLKRRMVLALGFEGGLVIFLVPVVSWVLGVSWAEAFLLDLGLMVFFLIYAFVYAWIFDKVFPRKVETGPVGTGPVETDPR